MLQYFKSLTTNPVLHQDYNFEQFDRQFQFKNILTWVVSCLFTLHSGMRDESWNFLSTFLQNLPIEVLFSADFDGVVQIIDFRQAIV